MKVCSEAFHYKPLAGLRKENYGIYVRQKKIMVRNSGAHDIRTLLGERITTTKKSIIKILQRMDGYNYSIKEAIPLGD